jgi:hypothetical protein
VKYFLRYIFLLTLTLPSFSAYSSNNFSSPGHVAMGNEVKIRLPSQTPDQPNLLLHLENGLSMSYGEILAMPDFYGADKPISQAETTEERRTLFMAAFNAFSSPPESVQEVMNICTIIQKEQKVILDGIQRGELPENIYKRLGYEFDRQYNCATGGGCSSGTWWIGTGRYLTLAQNNFDHFGEHAMVTYQVGHQIALEHALLAHQTGDEKELELAYAINAFASHFLSDRFAAGHMRTPRVELASVTTPSAIGSILSTYMHEEENDAGLHVHNARGTHWIAYGDKSYFNPKIELHKSILIAALQSSADSIYLTWRHGNLHTQDDVAALLPQTNENGPMSIHDIAPLFYWDEPSQKLMRRVDITNHHDRNWTDNWWGWTTLIALKDDRGISEKSEAILNQIW